MTDSQATADAEFVRRRNMPQFLHDFARGGPTGIAAFGTTDWPLLDEACLARLRDAINQEIDAAPNDLGLWSLHIGHHREVVDLLNTSLPEAGRYLDRMFSTPLTSGFQQGVDTYDAVQVEGFSSQHILRDHIDKLAALAEALGAVPVENPEQGLWGELVHRNVDELLSLIESRLGMELKAPPFQGGLYGLQIRHGLFSNRDFAAIQVASRIAELCPDRDAPICEIGGGAGYLAYYCWLFGYRNYTIIDLPTVNLAQGYFLARNIPDAPLILSTASEPFGNAPGIRILTPHFFHAAPEQHFAMVVNMDSLPEIGVESALEYIRAIPRKSRYFLSFNQEAMAPQPAGAPQPRVFDLVSQTTGLHRLSRHPWWMRKAYVEELYQAPQDDDRPPKPAFERENTDLSPAIKAQDDHIASLNSYIESLAKTSDAKIKELEVVVADSRAKNHALEASQAELSAALRLKDDHIAGLDSYIAAEARSRESVSREFSDALLAKDRHIADLDALLNRSHAELKRILSHPLWRAAVALKRTFRIRDR